MLNDVVKRVMHALLLMLYPLSASAVNDADSALPATMQSTAIASDHVSADYLVQLIVGLLFVLLCIVVLAWLAKRFNRLQSSSDGSLQVLGGISMGARERVVLVQVGATQLLLGVAPGRINMLHQLEQPIERADTGSALNRSLGKGFAEKLNSALARNS